MTTEPTVRDPSPMLTGQLDVVLRAVRIQAGLSQSELAARAGVTRQTVSAIEAGRAAPTIAVALRLARVLGRGVDELFRLVDELPAVQVELVEPGDASVDGLTRAQVAEVDGRIVAHPLTGPSGVLLTLPRANAFVEPGTRPLRARLFVPPEVLPRTLVAVGCDPAMSLLAHHCQQRHPMMEVVWRGGNSLTALQAVARGEAHLAGSHLWDPTSDQFNLPFARRIVGDDIRLITFAVWEQGLMVAPRNPKGIHTVADLTRPDVRLANREAGSGARDLLDRELRQAGLEPGSVAGYRAEVRSHLAAAEAVAAGLADAAIGARAAAQALGLAFIPLAQERYDLVIPSRFLEHQPIQALLDTLTSRLFRLEIESLGGYDVSSMGDVVQAA